ncbi:MAG TPA: outer membrane beta-barrel protein [Hyphomicrobiaceae bacterium]|jgi:outer membrane immunogenic protein
MKRLILGVAAALLLSAGPAAADGLPSKGHVRAAPETAAAPNWNGFYVGAGIGAGAVVHDTSVNLDYRDIEVKPDSVIDGGGTLFSIDGIGGEGIFGTVTVGYDRVIRPGWVAGAFVDYDFGSSISTDVSILGHSASIDHDHSWAVGGRLGFLTNPSTLVYGTAGYTQAEFDYFGLLSKTFDGYFVGTGIESFLRDNWTLKLEYRFSQFNSETLATFGPLSIDDEPSMHTARLVLSYRFGQHD